MNSAEKILGRCLNTKSIKFDKITKNKYSEVFLAGQHKGKYLYDKTGYYAGYCQCPCAKCMKGDKHCQSLACRGD